MTALDQHPELVLSQWLKTAQGQLAAAWIQQQADSLVDNIFGYCALQIGFAEYNLLKNNRIREKFLVSHPLAISQADPAYDRQHIIASDLSSKLPLANESVDLIILPLIFELFANPHQILREIDRVLVHNGQVIIAGFNPHSLWRLRNQFSPGYLPVLRPNISPHRLRDWMQLLSFEIDRGHFGCYEPGFKSARRLQKWRFMNQAGDRWWPDCGSIYMVRCRKTVCSMHLLSVPWYNKKIKNNPVVSTNSTQSNYEKQSHHE
ncbi:class I SAM-dependent methyltransferase [Brackiella oedipodis]|uniref:class I SAM-dependent methyltransferase n=1 Tax=Brackiella oedipodis TaxID=124225 RepID=UPI00146FC2E0|nr:class I SAM-dependent methyltransferase [Brackiella oedipodis]